MSHHLPLGERESLHLELKGREALASPETIAREVVAMLNAEGGTIWVGLREENGRAVALEAIPDPLGEIRKLRDHLVDTIEPPISDREVTIESLDDGEGSVLRVRANPGEGGPYAFLKGMGRHFVIRVGGRVRQMSREEIFQGSGSEARLREAEDKVLAQREMLLDLKERRFWLFFAPVSEISLDLQKPELEEILRNPLLTGNRLSGWNFSKFQHRPLLSQGKLTTSPQDVLRVEIRRNGELRFEAPLGALHWKGDKDEIWPPVLIEYIVSAMRMAASVYRGTLRPTQLVLVDLALAGVKGWLLRPGTPGIWFSGEEPQIFTDADDLLLPQPLSFRSGEIDAESDRCGYRLVERVYEAFGLRRSNIPKLFDRETGRLIFEE